MVETIKPTEEVDIKRTKGGKFRKGFCANPGGLPTAGRRTGKRLSLLMSAIKEVERTQSDTLLKHAIKRAYKDDVVLIAIMRKLIPDLKSLEVDTKEDKTWQIILTSFKDVMKEHTVGDS